MFAWQQALVDRHPQLRKQYEKDNLVRSLFAENPCYIALPSVRYDREYTGCILEHGHTGEHVAIKLTVLCQCQGGWYPCLTPHNEGYCPSANQDPGDEDGGDKFYIRFTRY